MIRLYLKLDRIAKNHKGTFGALSFSADNHTWHPFCVTLEPEDKNNQVGISCINAGTYICERYSSSKYPNTWIITDVFGRTYVLFHAGNTEYDTRGCILLAQHFGKLYGNLAILNSGRTFEKFMNDITEGADVLMLTIKDSV